MKKNDEKKPDKIIYDNQKEIYNKILNHVKSILPKEVEEAYFFGSLVKKEFGKYTEEYHNRKVSDIDIALFIDNDKIPKEWKDMKAERSWWKGYHCDKIKINGLKHPIDAIIVKSGKEEYARQRIKEKLKGVLIYKNKKR